ncbi:hypothetical protein D3C85_428860 [compost metagenome]
MSARLFDEAGRHLSLASVAAGRRRHLPMLRCDGRSSQVAKGEDANNATIEFCREAIVYDAKRSFDSPPPRQCCLDADPLMATPTVSMRARTVPDASDQPSGKLGSADLLAKAPDW